MFTFKFEFFFPKNLNFVNTPYSMGLGSQHKKPADQLSLQVAAFDIWAHLMKHRW